MSGGGAVVTGRFPARSRLGALFGLSWLQLVVTAGVLLSGFVALVSGLPAPFRWGLAPVLVELLLLAYWPVDGVPALHVVHRRIVFDVRRRAGHTRLAPAVPFCPVVPAERGPVVAGSSDSLEAVHAQSVP